MEEKKIIEMRGIYKKFGNVNALNGVDLDLREGEVLGLVGDNAAGKSTLCKILSGALQPTIGDILVNDQKQNFVSPADAKKNFIEMVYQDLALCNSIDVTGNLFLGRELVKNYFGFKFLDKKMLGKKCFFLRQFFFRPPQNQKLQYLAHGGYFDL